MSFRKPLSFIITGVFFLMTGRTSRAQTTDLYPVDVMNKIRDVENSLAGVEGTEIDSSWNILDRMSHYNIPGVSIAVIHDYKTEWVKGYGWADENAKIPVTARTRFQAASISKSLNAVGVLKLAQDKKLDLYADINKYLTDWKFSYDAKTNNKKISTIELLSHTAGLNAHGFAGYDKNAALPTIFQILDGQPPANSPPIRSMIEPGTRSEYSGGGITVSQLIVMDITGKPYARYMQEEVLSPLGMESSSYEQPTKLDPALLATGYRENGEEVPGKFHVYPEQAAAGLWTTPTDLGKYIIETQLAHEGRSAKVLNQKMTRLRLAPYGSDAAALGVFINQRDSTVYFQHSGGNEGFRCQYYGSLTGGNGLVIMVNSDNYAIIPEIVNSIARVYHLKGLTISKPPHKMSALFIISISIIIFLVLAIFFWSIKRKQNKQKINSLT